VSISASDYVIKIFNDLLQTDRRTIKDEFIITFSSGLNPPLPSNLTVNGIDRTAGLVSITLFADSSPYNGWQNLLLVAARNSARPTVSSRTSGVDQGQITLWPPSKRTVRD